MWTKDKKDYWLVKIRHIFEMLEYGFITREEATVLLNQLREEMGLPRLKKFEFM